MAVDGSFYDGSDDLRICYFFEKLSGTNGILQYDDSCFHIPVWLYFQRVSWDNISMSGSASAMESDEV